VDLPHELPGIVPTPEWKLLHHHHAWYPGDTVITGIGQGSLVTTPLQLATAVATLAEHGKRVQPHLLLRSLQADGAVYTPDSSISQIQLNNNLLWDIVIQAMQQVILSPIGTAHAFGHQTLYTVAGKTGTAQVYGGGSNLNDDANRPYKLKNNHLFISFAPVDRPQIAMVVVVEHAALADKISREILDFYFQHPLKK
jgi:penicillin-binding protein 2